VFLSLFISDGEFKSSQLKNERVQKAYKDSEENFRKLYKEKGINFDKQNIFIRVFKREKEMELWIKNNNSSYTLLSSYPICGISGTYGPKRQKGDYQVPEGFYYIDRFNPQSTFYLSLGLNYPNASDKILSDPENPGGDIFIHGSCVSIGCMAMTNEKIKELYIAAVEAKNNGQNKIPVHIFPFRMSEENMIFFTEKYKENEVLINFWKNIKTGFDYFEKNKKLSSVSVNNKGKYLYN
jgi:murein L,D-transpeptidase YafK